MWVALGGPNQALSLVLAAEPAGGAAKIFPAQLTEEQRRPFE